MTKAYISLGSNIGERFENLQRAIDGLALLPKTSITAVSRVYETLPVGFQQQRSFYNAAVEVETELSAKAFLGCCLGLEAGMGRRRLIKQGPRILDVDLLLFGDQSCDDGELSLPHPQMLSRGFVLVPLCEINPDPALLAAKTRVSLDGITLLDEQLSF